MVPSGDYLDWFSGCIYDVKRSSEKEGWECLFQTVFNQWHWSMFPWRHDYLHQAKDVFWQEMTDNTVTGFLVFLHSHDLTNDAHPYLYEDQITCSNRKMCSHRKWLITYLQGFLFVGFNLLQKSSWSILGSNVIIGIEWNICHTQDIIFKIRDNYISFIIPCTRSLLILMDHLNWLIVSRC